MSQRIVGILLIIIVSSLAAVVVMNNVILLHGLFDPRVDNDKIFPVLGHSYDTIVGGFIGLITGLVLGKTTPPP